MYNIEHIFLIYRLDYIVYIVYTILTRSAKKQQGRKVKNMRYGFSIIWKVGKKEHSAEFETMSEANAKAKELRKKGYHGIRIVQCIF